VIPASDNLERLVIFSIGDSIDQAVVARDPARPPSIELSPQRLRLAKPLERTTGDIRYQLVNLAQYLGIRRLPI
jgi:hypothetical protein